MFYECLCPDSKSFVLNHLLPSFEKAPHLLKLELIPYGKAEVSVFRLRMMRWVYAVVFSPSVRCYSYRTLIACFGSQQKYWTTHCITPLRDMSWTASVVCNYIKDYFCLECLVLTKMLYIYLELFLNKLGSGIKVGSRRFTRCCHVVITTLTLTFNIWT